MPGGRQRLLHFPSLGAGFETGCLRLAPYIQEQYIPEQFASSGRYESKSSMFSGT